MKTDTMLYIIILYTRIPEYGNPWALIYKKPREISKNYIIRLKTDQLYSMNKTSKFV